MFFLSKLAEILSSEVSAKFRRNFTNYNKPMKTTPRLIILDFWSCFWNLVNIVNLYLQQLLLRKKFSIKDLMKESLIENFSFSAVYWKSIGQCILQSALTTPISYHQ